MLHENYTELLSVTGNGTYTLNDSLSNYKMLFFIVKATASAEKHMLAGSIPVSLLRLYNSANVMLTISTYAYNLAYEIYCNDDNTVTLLNFAPSSNRFIMYGI